MGWEKSVKDELAKFDVRLVLVFILACIVIIIYGYYLKSPSDYLSRLLRTSTSAERNLYRSLFWHVKTFIILFVLPLAAMVLLNRFTDRKHSPVRYTFTLGDHRLGIKLVVLFVGVTVSVHYILVLMGLIDPDAYPMCKSRLISDYLLVFLLFEFSQLLLTVGFEYFFRGFLLIEAERVIGSNALVITLLPYIIMKFGKPPIEIFTATLVGIVLAYMTIRTRSFWYAVAAHWLLAAMVDVLSVYVI